MGSKIANIAAGTSVVILLGLGTAVLARDDKITVKLPAKSCTWMGAGKDHFHVVASGHTTVDTDSGTTWKCSNGSWSQVGTPPPKNVKK